MLLKLTIIYDNTSDEARLKADWGFAALIEAHGKSILFDTGANGKILLDNMQVLNIGPGVVTDVFISHNHFDHTGGLSHFLNENNDVAVHTPPTFRGVKYAREVIEYPRPSQIYPGFYTTGELDQIEQSLLVETEKGLMVVAGCSHPDMRKILNTAGRFGSVYGIIGGLHGFNEFELFENLQYICPTHCTEHIDGLNKRYPQAVSPGGAGRVIQI